MVVSAITNVNIYLAMQNKQIKFLKRLNVREKTQKLQDSECIRSLIVQNTNIVEKW